MRKIFFILITMALFLFFVPLSMAQKTQTKYVNGIDASFPPFAYVGTDNVPAGFDIDMLAWIGKEAGFEVEHRPMEWSGIILSLKNKNIDMIASGLSVTKERAKQVDFTEPYWIIKQVVVVHKDSKLTLEEALSGGYKIGIQSGTSEAAAMASENNKPGRKYNLMLTDSGSLAALDVENGRFDAAVMNDAPAAELAARRNIKILGEAGIPAEYFAIAVPKGETELLNLLNEYLKKIQADPYWEELVAKYKPGEVK